MANEAEAAVVTAENNNKGEGTEVETIAIPKSDYDKLNQDLGSLKRELKDLKKPKEETRETPKSNQSDDTKLLERMEKIAFKAEGITHPDDIDLARATAKKWNMDVEEVLADPDFKAKLERQQTERSNIQATSGVKGSAGVSQAKNTLEYWKAKGVPPTPADVPDRNIRQKIVVEMMRGSKEVKKFYND